MSWGPPVAGETTSTPQPAHQRATSEHATYQQAAFEHAAYQHAAYQQAAYQQAAQQQAAQQAAYQQAAYQQAAYQHATYPGWAWQPPVPPAPLAVRHPFLWGFVVTALLFATLAGTAAVVTDTSAPAASEAAKSSAKPPPRQPKRTKPQPSIGGPALASIADNIDTDGSPEAAAAIKAVGTFPPAVLDRTLAQVRENDVDVRITKGKLTDIVSKKEAKDALGIYDSYTLAISPETSVWVRSGSSAYVSVLPGRRLPSAVTRLKMETVAFHEWGHLFDDALVSEPWWKPPVALSHGAKFRKLCRSLPDEVLAEFRTTWKTRNERVVCSEIFAEGVARLAGAPRELKLAGGAVYRVPRPFDWVEDAAGKKAERMLDAYFADLLATLPRSE